MTTPLLPAVAGLRVTSGSVDAIVTDPPYGLAGRVFDFPHKHYSAINEAWDTFAPTDWMAACQRVLKSGGSATCAADAASKCRLHTRHGYRRERGHGGRGRNVSRDDTIGRDEQ